MSNRPQLHHSLAKHITNNNKARFSINVKPARKDPHKQNLMQGMANQVCLDDMCYVYKYSCHKIRQSFLPAVNLFTALLHNDPSI